MCLTDKIFLQTHVTFCEYLVFHEFKRNLYITKYLEQEGIANIRQKQKHIIIIYTNFPIPISIVLLDEYVLPTRVQIHLSDKKFLKY